MGILSTNVSIQCPSTVTDQCPSSEEVSVSFLKDAKGLHVTILTERLYIRSIENSDVDAYCDLLSDAEVMKKYATGTSWPKDKIVDRVQNIWAERWRNNNPYSGLAVFTRDTKQFIGHVILGQTSTSGVAELAYLFKKAYWNQKYGTEAVSSVVKAYAPETIKKGYMLKNRVLKKITATAKMDNLPSMKILEKLGMRQEAKQEKYGGDRVFYSMKVNVISKYRLRNIISSFFCKVSRLTRKLFRIVFHRQYD